MLIFNFLENEFPLHHTEFYQKKYIKNNDSFCSILFVCLFFVISSEQNSRGEGLASKRYLTDSGMETIVWNVRYHFKLPSMGQLSHE